MKRGILVAVGGAAMVIVGLSGCSSEDKAESPVPAPRASADTQTADNGAPAGASSENKVAIDGQDQKITGTVVCSKANGNMNIAIGDATTGIVAVVGEGDSPAVQSVALGNVNGVVLGFQSGAGQGEANATKDGDTYNITGTATGIDAANPMQPMTKPFEIAVNCP